MTICKYTWITSEKETVWNHFSKMRSLNRKIEDSHFPNCNESRHKTLVTVNIARENTRDFVPFREEHTGTWEVFLSNLIKPSDPNAIYGKFREQWNMLMDMMGYDYQIVSDKTFHGASNLVPWVATCFGGVEEKV